ncbi:bifunctional folylpolyglutamate synthase/dihydrofolate synthase [Aneurinibacillus sp. Ricciae_BoGa-3]|uniref:bifunctional folylpolyglutamate synthase/dihydrofolate synthase n=1 Tax=Aneurinibacillus sp. Ricciae_BoGa-3 TaxID=3022697 RepID=UPI0023424257|nr:folylpolyglutamate synthase/dihydrofolate synthase family protein [Aneurinibacillus sp. Ricciae_BoGa-3]WCK53660.1 bifunctional folylpolyglutamate synthase/dihydrofolate synthase [Aneurinibacillus sp. Ricciae_BoGa-3]
MNSEHNLTDALAWLNSLEKADIRPGLERMEYMMERLGHPERRLKFIHIAGTNGKGSTSAFLNHILMKAGHHVGFFMSPYIESFYSRIQYNGEPISHEDLTLLTQRIRPIVEEMNNMEAGAPTEFEVVTALAILYFATVTFPDVVIWEAGLGGRLDSTNIVNPIASVITSIGLDHMNILGDTIPLIAAEKAGIIKSGVPVITGVRDPQALQVIEETAKQKRAAIYRPNREYQVNRNGKQSDPPRESFDFQGLFGSLQDCRMNMAGQHQVENAGVALMTLQVLNQYYAMYVNEQHIREGLLETAWPGRFEKISDAPVMILDGAHNVAGTRMLRQTIEEYYPERRVSLLFGVLADKQYEQMIEILAPICSEVWVTRIDSPRAESPEKIAGLFRKHLDSDKVHAFADWKEALHAIVHTSESESLLLATGSLYFIADVRKEWQEKYKKAGE